MAIASLVAEASAYLPFIPRPRPRFVTEDGRRVHGIMAEFETPEKIFHAAEQVRDAGYTRWDVNTPFPIHDMEEAMGVRTTILPYVVFGAGLSGVGLAWLMQQYMNNWDYEFVVQGKPYGAWEPFVPIMFELGILSAAFAALVGMLALNGLPRFHHPLLTSDRFLRTSDDRFVIAIEADDPAFEPEATRELLERAGGGEIDLVLDEEEA